MPDPITPPIARNERGQFLPRNTDDTPIGVVLNEAEEGRRVKAEADEEAAAQKPRGREAKETKPANFKVEGAAAEFFADVLGEEYEPDKDKEKGKEADPNKTKDKAKEKDAVKPKDEKDKEKPKPAAATPKVQPKPAATSLSAEEIATIAAETAARVNGARKTNDAKKEEDTVPPEQARKFETLKKMEELWPDKYRDASKRFKAAQDRILSYAQKWEAAHPGETFDGEADDHKDFFEKNDGYEFWDEEDYNDARLEIIADRRSSKVKEEQNKEINAKLSKLERAEKLRESVPQIIAQQKDAAKLIWTEFGEGYADVMKDGVYNKEKAAELIKSDPVGFSHRLAVAKDLDREAEEVYKLFNGLIDFDSKNPVHLEMSSFAERMEGALAKAPLEDKTDSEGRTFLPSEDYYKLPAAKRGQHWTLQANDVIFKRAKILAREAAEKSKSDEERLTQLAEARGWKKPDVKEADNEKRKEPDKEKQADDDDDADGKPGGPSSTPQSQVAALKNANGADHPNSKKSFFDEF